MTARRGPLRTTVAALAALAVFSLLFSLLAERGLWPELPPGALHNTDLAAGFVAVIAWIVLVATGRQRNPARDAASAVAAAGSTVDPTMEAED